MQLVDDKGQVTQLLPGDLIYWDTELRAIELFRGDHPLYFLGRTRVKTLHVGLDFDTMAGLLAAVTGLDIEEITIRTMKFKSHEEPISPVS